MRTLLVYPAFPDTFWSFRHALRFVRKRAAIPPLGLITVAGLLPSDWETRLVDVNVRRLTEADLRWADLVMIGGMTIQQDSAKSIIQRAKAMGKRVVAGGPLFTCEPEKFAEVDHLVLDEAEQTLPQFLADLQAGCAERVYTSETKPDMTQTPTPRWELLDIKRYGQMAVQFSRGCPFDCDFCNVTALFGRKPRTKNVPQMVAELDALYATGYRGSIFFVDDNLIGNKKAANELLPALTRWRKGKPHMPLSTEASINLADDVKLTKRMVEAGFDRVFVGIETPDTDALTECSKKQNLKRDLVADVRKLHQAGIQVQAGFILGFDSDTPSIFQRQIDFIQQSGICTAMVGILQAPVGTRLYQRLSVEGRLVGESSGDNVDGSTNVVTRMPLDTLQAGYRRVMRYIYAPEPYYQRVKTFLKDYTPPRIDAPGKLKQTLRVMPAFARSIVQLGVLHPGRWQYWKLLGWTALWRRQHLPLAVTLWVYGHHFREVGRQRLAV